MVYALVKVDSGVAILTNISWVLCVVLFIYIYFFILFVEEALTEQIGLKSLMRIQLFVIDVNES